MATLESLITDKLHVDEIRGRLTLFYDILDIVKHMSAGAVFDVFTPRGYYVDDVRMFTNKTMDAILSLESMRFVPTATDSKPYQIAAVLAVYKMIDNDEDIREKIRKLGYLDNVDHTTIVNAQPIVKFLVEWVGTTVAKQEKIITLANNLFSAFLHKGKLA
jgi:hypothetical protein